MAMILITHDLGLAARWCDRIAVMEAGRVVEQGATERLFEAPAHPYTRRLVAASPTREFDPGRPGARCAEGRAQADRAQSRHAAVAGIAAYREVVRRSDARRRRSSRSACRQEARWAWWANRARARAPCRVWSAGCWNPDDGDIVFDGESIARIPARDFHKAPQRRDIQIVFQDPNDSLNPRYTTFDSIAHPLRRLEGLRDGSALTTRVRDAADRAGLPMELLQRFPHQLSGGQKARVGIARAVAPRPRLMILDEPTAALDVSVQAVILQLLDRLRREEGIGLLFVSHDLNVVRMLCDDLVVLQAGKVMEAGPSQEIFQRPKAEYYTHATRRRALLRAAASGRFDEELGGLTSSDSAVGEFEISGRAVAAATRCFHDHAIAHGQG